MEQFIIYRVVYVARVTIKIRTLYENSNLEELQTKRPHLLAVCQSQLSLSGA